MYNQGNMRLHVDLFITSPPEGVARYCFHPVCLSVCLSVCVCVCVSGRYFGILFLGYQKRYRSKIYTGYFIGQMSRSQGRFIAF